MLSCDIECYPVSCCDEIQEEDVLQKAVDSVQPVLNMDSTAEKLNNTRTELGRIILLCLSFMKYCSGVGMQLFNSQYHALQTWILHSTQFLGIPFGS